MIIVQISQGVVVRAETSTVRPDGWLEVVPPTDTAGMNQINAPVPFTFRGVSKSHVVGGVLVPRPMITPTVSGAVVTVPSGPTGTTVTLVDSASAEVILILTADVDDWSDGINLEDAGTYLIVVEPPLPYLTDQIEVTVT